MQRLAALRQGGRVYPHWMLPPLDCLLQMPHLANSVRLSLAEKLQLFRLVVRPN